MRNSLEVPIKKLISPVVLCGGSGKRVWPLISKSLPKQFAPMIAGKILLQATFERVAQFHQTIRAVASKEHRFLVCDAMEAAGLVGTTILEPFSRNTAPAMAVAALNAEPDEILLFLPADHHIPNVGLFKKTIDDAIPAAQGGRFVTFGVVPTHPHTGYGYIRAAHSDDPVRSVQHFIEKPDAKKAAAYLISGDYYWNSGILLVRADALIAALKTYAPDVFEATHLAVKHQLVEADLLHLDPGAFSRCPAASVDHLVLEQHPDVVMTPFSGGWSDVGSWNAVAELTESDIENNATVGRGKVYQARDTYIYATQRPVVALGTESLGILYTAGGVLVAAKTHAEQVKDVVEDLKKTGMPEATEHRHASRPWGEYDTIDEGDCFKVKRINVKPGASLSLQRHQYRAEHWVVVKGTARVTRGDQVFLLRENESTFIPLGMKHRLENPGTMPLQMIEVQSGNYLGEDDIERFDDDYGRASSTQTSEKKDTFEARKQKVYV